MSKKWVALFVVLFALIFLAPVFIATTISGYLALMFLYLSVFPVMFLFLRIAMKIRRRFLTNSKADKEELRREDDVLLQGTALSQSVFFIYLSLIPSSPIIEILKWTVPIIAISFYIIRAYSKIKDSARYRYYSIFLLVSMIIEIGTFVFLQINHFLYIEEHDVSSFYISLIFAGFFLLFLFGISDALKRRYGYI